MFFKRTKFKANKKLKLKIDFILKKIYFWRILNQSNIILFCINSNLKAEDMLNQYLLFLNKNCNLKVINKQIYLNLINKKFLIIIKNFNNLIKITNLNEIKNLEKMLKENNFIIKGYLIKNIFFFKTDLHIKYANKVYIYRYLKKFYYNMFTYLKKIYIYLKKYIKKLIKLMFIINIFKEKMKKIVKLKKKYDNNKSII